MRSKPVLPTPRSWPGPPLSHRRNRGTSSLSVRDGPGGTDIFQGPIGKNVHCPFSGLGCPGACGAPARAIDRHLGSCWNLGLQGRISALEEYWKLLLYSRAGIETSHSLNPFGWSSGTSRHDLIKRGLLNRQGFSACCTPVTSRLGDSSRKLPYQSYSMSSNSSATAMWPIALTGTVEPSASTTRRVAVSFHPGAIRLPKHSQLSTN